MDIRTLQYWHKLEHFYPYILQEQKNENIKTTLVGEDGALPDFLRPELEPGRVVRNYRVYLGIFRVEPAMAALEEGIGRQMRFRDTGEDESCFCTFRLNPDGTVLPDSFQISSFPWAIHRVRDGKINVDQWDDDFLQFQRDIFTILAQREEPVDYPFLLALRETFAQRVNWRIQYCQSWLRIDRVAGRQQQAQGAPGQPGEEAAEEIQAENESTDEQVKKNDLLNSFYIRDLERVIAAAQQGQYPEVLRRFLEHQAEDRVDVERDLESVFRLMAPQNLPMGRWPSDYGARFMQQVDVNAFLTEDPAYAQPLFSVNGPPGTGKTTLLKDVVAAIVTRRAEALLSLAVPDDAFYPEEEGVVTYRNYSNYIWRLRPAFQEFGILVASNNNGAVENITHGLPGRDGLPDRYEVEEYRYFAEVSDRLLGEGKTWALNAVALGNKKNRQRFVQNLWPLRDDEVKGGYNFRVSLRETQKEWEPRMWQEAKARFSAKLREVREEYKVLEEVFGQASELRALRRRLAERAGRLPELAAAPTAAGGEPPAAPAGRAAAGAGRRPNRGGGAAARRRSRLPGKGGGAEGAGGGGGLSGPHHPAAGAAGAFAAKQPGGKGDWGEARLACRRQGAGRRGPAKPGRPGPPGGAAPGGGRPGGGGGRAGPAPPEGAGGTAGGVPAGDREPLPAGRLF